MISGNQQSLPSRSFFYSYCQSDPASLQCNDSLQSCEKFLPMASNLKVVFELKPSTPALID